MSVHYEPSRDRCVVRWRDGGRNRSRRFLGLEEAEAFDRALRAPAAVAPVAVDARAGDGIYAYETKAGVRFRFVFRQSDGSLSTRRGYTSRRVAATARRRLVESIERGEVKVARETFGEFWTCFLEERRPYLTSGAMRGSSGATSPQQDRAPRDADHSRGVGIDVPRSSKSGEIVGALGRQLRLGVLVSASRVSARPRSYFPRSFSRARV